MLHYIYHVKGTEETSYISVVQTSSQDADKVYLAAIDKFEAMMGLSDKYACGGMYTEILFGQSLYFAP